MRPNPIIRLLALSCDRPSNYLPSRDREEPNDSIPRGRGRVRASQPAPTARARERAAELYRQIIGLGGSVRTFLFLLGYRDSARTDESPVTGCFRLLSLYGYLRGRAS